MILMMSMRAAFHFYICLAKQKQTNDEHQSFKQHGNLDTNKYKLIKCSRLSYNEKDAKHKYLYYDYLTMNNVFATWLSWWSAILVENVVSVYTSLPQVANKYY